MDYDPVKDRLIQEFEGSVGAQRLFFKILHTVFLRSWFVRRTLRRILDANPKARVLDAGTGFGQYTDWILRHYPQTHVTAIDIKEDYLARLRGYLRDAGLSGRADIRYGDLTSLRETGPFDLVLSVDVMEHIEEDELVFAHFNRVLVPGGALVVNTPSDQGGSDVRDEDDESFIGEHVRDGYGREEIARKLLSAGFKQPQIEFGYGPAGSLAWRLLVRVPIGLLNHGMWTLPLVALWYVAAFPLGLVLNAADVAVDQPTGTGITVVARA